MLTIHRAIHYTVGNDRERRLVVYTTDLPEAPASTVHTTKVSDTTWMRVALEEKYTDVLGDIGWRPVSFADQTAAATSRLQAELVAVMGRFVVCVGTQEPGAVKVDLGKL